MSGADGSAEAEDPTAAVDAAGDIRDPLDGLERGGREAVAAPLNSRGEEIQDQPAANAAKPKLSLRGQRPPALAPVKVPVLGRRPRAEDGSRSNIMTKSKNKEARPNERGKMTLKEMCQVLRDAPVTLEEFKRMAKRGRIRGGDDDPVKPSKRDLKKARSAVDFGRLYGYSEDDIARFYLRFTLYRFGRRRDLPEFAYIQYVCDSKFCQIPPIRAEGGPTEHHQQRRGRDLTGRSGSVMSSSLEMASRPRP